VARFRAEHSVGDGGVAGEIGRGGGRLPGRAEADGVADQSGHQHGQHRCHCLERHGQGRAARGADQVQRQRLVEDGVEGGMQDWL